MDNLPVVYLSILLIVLLGSGVFVFRQVLKTRKTENALGRLQKKLSKDKGTVQECYELGSIYLEKKLYSQAIALFQKAIKAAEQETEENIAPIYNGLGYAAFSQEQYDLAIRHYKEALKENPDYIFALNNLGHAYEKKSLMTPALETYEQVLKSEPNNTTAKRRAESIRKRLVTS
ncbi:tetratricopeptide repeat protein [Synechocystis sp. PCC 7509]|uniref:tetratricopeptide repeat protein n=1 Tax=Synechocystis sp. PCC 7509 TaxID=927677 RepID=UPI0002ABAF92|nr:tetratricopeptide repeat protein [Synechocystis sp. PCC 7509]